MKKRLFFMTTAAGLLTVTGCAGMHDAAIGLAEATTQTVIEQRLDAKVNEGTLSESSAEVLKAHYKEQVKALFAKIEEIRRKVNEARTE